MLSAATLLSLALALPAASAGAVQGFNYGSLETDGVTPKTYDDFKSSFQAAQALAGTNGAFSSARLYTMRQGATTTPISALQAASDTSTSLLLGMWASAGSDDFNEEVTALQNAIKQYPSLKSLITGISVGSEDMYRVTPFGIANNAGAGADAETILGYIKQTKAALSGTAWDGVMVGHVDTWNAFADNPDTNVPSVIAACDFLGVDEYPYYQTQVPNSIDDAKEVFDTAYGNVTAVAQGKPIWVTETGWPSTGPKTGLAVASVANAQQYWDQVGCPLFGKTNVWWYDLNDGSSAGDPIFTVLGTNGKPVYDLNCADAPKTTSSASSTATSTASSTGKSTSSTATSSSSGSGSGAGVGVGSGSSSAGASGSTGPYSNSTTSSSGSSSNSTSSSGSSSSSSSGSGTTSSGSGSASSTPLAGTASTIGSSAVGIFGAVAAAVLLL